MTTQAWHSLYIPSKDSAAIETAVEQALLQQGYKRYDPFPGGSGLTAHIWRQRVRHFLAPPESGWTRLLGEPDADGLPAIAAGLGLSILYAWLDESGGDLAVWTADGPADDLGGALRGWLRPDRRPDDLARALAGDAPVPAVEDAGPQVLAVPLPPDVAALADSVDPNQAEKMMDRLTRQVFGKLGGGQGGDDPQAAAQSLLGQGGAALWNTPAGRRLRAVISCLTIAAGWREPDFATLQAAYQVARARQHRPDGLRLPGDDEALARVPDALAYRPLYVGAR
jgi:hypothetical protein